MKYTLLIIYLCSYSSGFAAITLIIICQIRTRLVFFRYYIPFITALTAVLILINIDYYRVAFLSKYDTYGNIITVLLYNLCYGVIIYTLPGWLYTLLGIKFSKVLKTLFGVLASSIVLITFVPYILFNPNFDLRQFVLINLTFRAIAIIMIGVNVFCIILMLSGIKNTPIQEKKTIIIIMLLQYIVFIPIWIFEYFWNFNLYRYIRPLSSTNVFYFIWNLFSVIFIGRYYFLNPEDITSLIIPDIFLQNYRITPSEKIIITRMGHGAAQ